MKLIVFIPARMESKRLPNKITKKIFDMPMIEHVVKRAKYSKCFDKIVVVSNNKKIKNILKKKYYKIIFSKKKHVNGTSRVSEVSKNFNYKLALILFADEPFIDPKKIKLIIKKLNYVSNYDVINIVTNLSGKDMYSREVIKCMINKNEYIKDYFRKRKTILNTSYKIYKSSGILIFKKDILDNFKKLKKSDKETKFKIEQFRFLENNLKVKSIFIPNLLPSINTQKELNDIIKLIMSKPKEAALVKKLQSYEY